MTTLTQVDVLRRIQSTQHWAPEECLNWAHTMWSVTNKYDDAYAAYSHATNKHPVNAHHKLVKPLALAPAYFAPTTHNKHGHVVLLGFDRGWCWSLDMGGNGTVTRQRIGHVREWLTDGGRYAGGQLLGWCSDINDVTLPLEVPVR